MQDEYSVLGYGLRPLMIEQNVAANGRWFCLAFVAINIADGNLLLAVLFAILIGLASIAEQFGPKVRTIAAMALQIWGVILALVTLVLVAS